MFDNQTTGLIKHFFRAYPERSSLLIGLLILAGLSEAIGIVSVLPLLELSLTSEAAEVSTLTAVVRDGLHAVGTSPRLEVLLALIVGGIALKSAFQLLAMKQVGYTVSRVSTELRLSLIEALLHARWAYFASQPIGRLSNAISSEANRSASAYRSACLLFAALVQVLVYATIAVMVSWEVALLAVVAGAVMFLLLGRLVRASRAAGRFQTEMTKSLIVRLTDALHGIKPLKAMGRENDLKPLLEAETRGINQAQERQVLASETVKASQEPILVFMMSLALYFAITVAAIPFSRVMVMAFLFYRLAGRISHLQTEYQAITTGESAFWSMQQSIRTAEEQREAVVRSAPPPPLERGIAIEALAFSYADKPVLRGVSMAIPAGEFVSIVGPSGAGKTTIVDLLVGFHQPQGGRITVDGVPLAEVDLHGWRQMVGYVPQEMFLFHDSVFKNVTLGDPTITREDAQAALTASGAWVFVESLPSGLDTVVGERGSRLSGGQRQRIAIARALVRKPALLILDEITTSLDPATEAAICATLRSLRGSVTIIAISHQAAMMEAADIVYRLEGGMVTHRGAEPMLTAAAR